MRTADAFDFQSQHKVREISELSAGKCSPLIGTPLKCLREGNTYTYTLNDTTAPNHTTSYSNNCDVYPRTKRRSIIFGSIIEEKNKGVLVSMLHRIVGCAAIQIANALLYKYLFGLLNEITLLERSILKYMRKIY